MDICKKFDLGCLVRQTVFLTLFLATMSIISSLVSAGVQADEKIHRFHHDHILGTSLDITLVGVDAPGAAAGEGAILAEITRLNGILSTYDTASELSRLNRASNTSSTAISADVRAVLLACEHWRAATDDHFSCLIGALTQAWQKAAQTDSPPDRTALRRIADIARETSIGLGPDANALVRPAGVIFAPNGLAKGYIIDKAFAAARAATPELRGMLIDIGGDIRFWGTAPKGDSWQLGVADPHAAGDNAAPLTVLSISAGAIATSGGQKRGFTIAGKQYPHIMSPRTGWVVEATAAATVTAPNAQDADALATAFAAMPVRKALKLANQLNGVETLLITADGRQFTSTGWRAQAADAPVIAKPAAMPGSTPALPANFQLRLNYTVPEIAAAKYRAPYVAIWLTDADKKLVTVLALLGSKKRWQEENYVWERRYGRKNLPLVDAISEPTRLPGQYHFIWDGVDDYGQRRRQGSYVLHIETAREYGAHKLIRLPLNLGTTPQEQALEADGEVGAVRLRYGAMPK